jgi:hypothetical protein
VAERSGGSEEDLPGDVMRARAIAGLMDPAGIAEHYLFLGSDGARNITSRTFGINRGEVLA